MTPPAGRPKSGKNRDLPPRLERRRSTRHPHRLLYYYRRSGTGAGQKIPLGSDYAKALERWRQLETEPLLAHARGFAAVAEEFRRQYIPHLKPETQRQYLAMLARLENVFKDALLDYIEPGDVGALRDEFKDSPIVFNRMRAVLSALWNWARSTKRTRLPNPCAGVHRYTESPAKGRITDAMFKAVRKHADPILRDWMDLTLTCGQRVSDVLKLKRTDIYSEGGKRFLDLHQGKTEHEYGVEIAGDLARVIDRLLTRARTVSGPYLIQTEDGQRVTYAMIRKRFDKAKAAARKETLAAGKHWRDFKRKDLRSKSAQDALTLEEAQERLGHTDARVTRRHYRRGTVAKPGRLPADEDSRNE